VRTRNRTRHRTQHEPGIAPKSHPTYGPPLAVRLLAAWRQSSFSFALVRIFFSELLLFLTALVAKLSGPFEDSAASALASD